MVADDDLNVGDRVMKVRGDYRFVGVVRACFYKQLGAVRYVVENEDGVLHIFSRQQLEKVDE
jgi:hypothetical protein